MADSVMRRIAKVSIASCFSALPLGWYEGSKNLTPSMMHTNSSKLPERRQVTIRQSSYYLCVCAAEHTVFLLLNYPKYQSQQDDYYYQRKHNHYYRPNHKASRGRIRDKHLPEFLSKSNLSFLLQFLLDVM
jgi:hypothetical protein